MSGWVIGSWDREAARGTIVSGLGELPFDAAVALVADFRPGERVEVRLERARDGWRVKRVEPVDWRPPPAPPPSPAEAFADALDAIEDTLRSGGWIDVRAGGDETLTLILLGPSAYDPERTVVFARCLFVQMPLVPVDFARVRSFRWTDFARDAPSIAGQWTEPGRPERFWVFRFEPYRFRDPAGYVLASGARLVGD
ncbi:MAG TPA: hypothetical protein RMH99_08365 [Sandaracinaceae bacterium LLY-WYZ-13_1]|nr:hypothetical protein [Sandaracinaceae bacterium LLY-WYZ-13_1]